MRPEELRNAIHGHMPQLDALRGIAILWVILHNAALDGVGHAQSNVMAVIGLIGNMGWAGVQLFFVLSGFLITGILSDNLGSTNQFRNFYARRTLRIFPLYYGFLLLAFVILPSTGLIHWADSTHVEKVLYFTYIANWAPLITGPLTFPHVWSLAIEEQYYLLWPFLVIFTRKRTLVFLCITLIVTAFLGRAYLVLNYDPAFSSQAMYTFTFARWDSLAIGSLLALLVRSETVLPFLQRYFMRSFIVLSGLLIMQVIVLRHFGAHGIEGIFNQTSVAFWFAMLILFSVVPWHNPLDRFRPLFSNKLLHQVGKYSYAIYIFHFPVKLVWFANFSIDVAPHAPWQQLGVVIYNFSGITLLTTAMAYISWHVLEQPFLKLKRRFAA